VNPNDAVASLPGSWDAISHNANQPLDALIETKLGIFASTQQAIMQPERRSPGRLFRRPF
jgi:hypothetical protein